MRMLKRLALLMLMTSCASVAGCAITTNECSWNKYIIPSVNDTILTKRSILEHNLAYEKHCD